MWIRIRNTDSKYRYISEYNWAFLLSSIQQHDFRILYPVSRKETTRHVNIETQLWRQSAHIAQRCASNKKLLIRMLCIGS
jgi:hypothetical protein